MGKRFLDAMPPNAEDAARDQPGCTVFDVLEAREEPDTFLLYEIYESHDALEDHKQTQHYHASRAVVTDLIERQSVPRSDAIAINPSH